MPRYWSDDALAYIECESICFTGPQATHTLLPRLGREQRDGQTMGTRGHRRGDLLSKREMIGKSDSVGAHWRSA